MDRNTRTTPSRARSTVLLADPHALVLDGLERLIETRVAVVGRVADGHALAKGKDLMTGLDHLDIV